MKLEEATKLAGQIVDSIKHLCDPEHIMVVGSIRRKKAEVADIDIVLIPQEWMWNTIIQKLKTDLQAHVSEAGQELARLFYGHFQIDIYRARPET